VETGLFGRQGDANESRRLTKWGGESDIAGRGREVRLFEIRSGNMLLGQGMKRDFARRRGESGTGVCLGGRGASSREDAAV